MTKPPTIIAIDGFSSCGKSTLAKALGSFLHYLYVDSGAMYRAITVFFLRKNIDPQNHKLVVDALDHDIHIDFKKTENQLIVQLNGEDVSEEIRTMLVSGAVSPISAIPEVRHKMVEIQQKLGKTHNLVMDGRDIGTVVFPQAQLKIFMSASVEIRSERRFKELLSKGFEISLEEVRSNLELRDDLDTNRKESPLRKAEDAIILDNSYLTPDQQLQFVIEQMQKRQLYP
jgi:cytidylate kinase